MPEAEPPPEVSIDPLMLEAARHVARMLIASEVGDTEAAGALEESQQQVIALMRGLARSDELWPAKHRNLAAGAILVAELEEAKTVVVPPRPAKPRRRAAKRPTPKPR